LRKANWADGSNSWKAKINEDAVPAAVEGRIIEEWVLTVSARVGAEALGDIDEEAQ
jgi:hypothetical protein